MKNLLSSLLKNNKGSGLGVILYGVTLLLILIFVAVNIVNSKVIEDGYNSLRDAVQSASTGSVIHLLTSNRSTTTAQNNIINASGAANVTDQKTERAAYDIYLQLALGYLINRNYDTSTANDTTVQSGEINNFIKLDHQKVVNSTMALLADAVNRNKNVKDEVGNVLSTYESISDTNKYKIIMVFIEPYADSNNHKYFDIIAYGNGDWNGNVTKELARGIAENKGKMKDLYNEIQGQVNSIVNNYYTVKESSDNYNINLNANGTDLAQKVREMETYPHYLIVVKDFALPTIFYDNTNNSYKTTNDAGTGIRGIFTALSGDGSLKSPMCALNTGKVQRQTEDKGWTKERWYKKPN